jgi:hypothetical protein
MIDGYTWQQGTEVAKLRAEVEALRYGGEAHKLSAVKSAAVEYFLEEKFPKLLQGVIHVTRVQCLDLRTFESTWEECEGTTRKTTVRALGATSLQSVDHKKVLSGVIDIHQFQEMGVSGDGDTEGRGGEANQPADDQQSAVDPDLKTQVWGSKFVVGDPKRTRRDAAFVAWRHHHSRNKSTCAMDGNNFQTKVYYTERVLFICTQLSIIYIYCDITKLKSIKFD